MRPKMERHSVYIEKDPQTPLRRWLSTKEWEFSTNLHTLAARYLDLIGTSMPKLNDQELCLAFDALRAPWTPESNGLSTMAEHLSEAIQCDSLDLKWKIDGEKLVAKVKRLSHAEMMALAEMADCFRVIDDGRPYDEVIREIKERMRPSPRLTARTQVTRMHAGRLPSIGSSDPHSHRSEERRSEETDEQPASGTHTQPGPQSPSADIEARDELAAETGDNLDARQELPPGEAHDGRGKEPEAVEAQGERKPQINLFSE